MEKVRINGRISSSYCGYCRLIREELEGLGPSIGLSVRFVLCREASIVGDSVHTMFGVNVKLSRTGQLGVFPLIPFKKIPDEFLIFVSDNGAMYPCMTKLA